MKKMLLGVSTLCLLLSAPSGIAKNKPKEQPKPVNLVLSPASTIPTADILKNLRVKCPNVSITLDSTKSDYMLEAGGWPGNYKFTMFKPGGQAVFATTTHILSNAVKDICGFIKTQK